MAEHQDRLSVPQRRVPGPFPARGAAWRAELAGLALADVGICGDMTKLKQTWGFTVTSRTYRNPYVEQLKYQENMGFSSCGCV